MSPLATQARPLGSPQSHCLSQVPSLNRIWHTELYFNIPQSTQGYAGIWTSSYRLGQANVSRDVSSRKTESHYVTRPYMRAYPIPEHVPL